MSIPSQRHLFKQFTHIMTKQQRSIASPDLSKKDQMPTGRKRLYTALSKIGMNDLNTIEWKRAKELMIMMTENDLPETKAQ